MAGRHKKTKKGAFSVHMKPEDIPPPDFKSGEPPSLGPQTSQCGKRAYISYQPLCLKCYQCGLYHAATEEQLAEVRERMEQAKGEADDQETDQAD